MFMEKSTEPDTFPIFTEALNFFKEFSRGIQEGRNAEFYHSTECLDILWPPDEYAFIKICKEDKTKQFYGEAQKMMVGLLEPNQPTEPLYEAVKLNSSMIKLPFQTNDLELQLSYNIWEIYRGTVIGETVATEPGLYDLLIDRTSEKWNSWDEWYEKMGWWCNRNGADL